MMMMVTCFSAVATVGMALPAIGRCGARSLILAGLPGYGAFGSCKFGVRELAESLHTELPPAGLWVSVGYLPGIDTSLLAVDSRIKPPELSALLGRVRVWFAERAAEAIVFGVARGRFLINGGLGIAALTPGHGQLSQVLRAAIARVVQRGCAVRRGVAA